MLLYRVLKLKKQINLNRISEPIYDLLRGTFKIPKQFNYQAIIIDPEYIARPDLLSLHLYGTENFADIICKLNGISNPFELNEGMCIIAPTVDNIESFYIDASSVNKSYETDEVVNSNKKISAKTLQKKKNEVRKANEQVIGDSNFRIDKTNKIIIY